MADSDATRAVLEAARACAASGKFKAAKRAEWFGAPAANWREYAPYTVTSLIDALAQYDREAKDE